MKRRIASFASVLALMVTGFFAAPAQAATNWSGSCNYGSGTAYIFIKESPTEGSLQYVSVDADDQIDRAASYDKPYYNDGAYVIATGRFESRPIDGDGLWNYRDTWDWVATGDYSQVRRVEFYIKIYGSQAYCTKTANI